MASNIINQKEGKKSDKNNYESFISANHLELAYPNIIALKDISVEIKKGEIFCLIGPNGSGKTTFVKLLTGQKKPTKGNISVKNLNPIKDRQKLVHIFGLVPQELALYDELTGRENLEFHAKLYDLPKDIIDQEIDKFLEVAGLKERQKDLVGTYSGGMKRRLQLVRALLHDPDIVILDEPTLGVDVQSRNAIHNYILELPKRGKTVVLTTNYMEEAEKLADRIVILDNKIVEGPAPFREIQIRIFPEKILEFQTENINMDTQLQNKIIEESLKGTLISVQDEDHNRTFRIKTELSTQEIMQQMVDLGKTHSLSIHGLTIKKPGLEEIFLKLTGRSFRDGAK